MEGAAYGALGAILFLWWNKSRKAKQAAKDSEQSQTTTQETTGEEKKD